MRKFGLFNKTVISVFLLLTLFTATAYAAFSAATKLTGTSKFESEPKLFAQNGELHSIFVDQTSQSSVSGNLYYKKKTGTAWQASQKLASNARVMAAGYAGHSITSNNGKAHVAYTVYDGDAEVVYKSNASGSWPANPSKITSNTGIQDFNPSIANLAGKLYMVFVRQQATGDTELFFSQNLSGTWSTPKPITNNAVEDLWPSLVAKNGKVYLAWISMGSNNSSSIKYRVLANGTWSSIKTAISSSAIGFAYAELVIYDGKPYITYMSMTSAPPSPGTVPKTGIGFTYLTASGWKTKNVTAMTNSSLHMSPSISNLGNKFRVAWFRMSMSTGDSDVMYGALNGIANNWNVSNATNTSKIAEIFPDIATDSTGKSHIMYSGGTTQTDIYYKKEQ